MMEFEKEHDKVEGSMTLSKWHAYSRLMRIDRPIGSLLLLWPTYWALWIALKVRQVYIFLIVFTAGVFFMRAAGCVMILLTAILMAT